MTVIIISLAKQDNKTVQRCRRDKVWASGEKGAVLPQAPSSG